MDVNVATYIDCCIGSKGSHYDIAKVCFEILKDQFRYVGDRVWQWKHPTFLEWLPDENKKELELAIRVQVSQRFMERALFWQEESLRGDMSLRIDCQIRSVRLLEICCKLGKERFIQQVIKDARSFFVHDDDGAAT